MFKNPPSEESVNEMWYTMDSYTTLKINETQIHNID